MNDDFTPEALHAAAHAASVKWQTRCLAEAIMYAAKEGMAKAAREGKYKYLIKCPDDQVARCVMAELSNAGFKFVADTRSHDVTVDWSK